MYNCRQPRASHWGLALAGTRRGWGQFGTRGVRVQPPELLSQCEVLHQLQVGKQMEQRPLQEPGKVEAARAAEGDARSRDVSSQPTARERRGSMGDLLSLPHLVPTREGMDAG